MSILSSSHLNPKTLTAAALAYAIHKSQEKEKTLLDDYYDHVDPVLEHAPYERSTRTSDVRPQFASVRRNIILSTPSKNTESSRSVTVTQPPASNMSSLSSRKPRRMVKPVSLDEDEGGNDSKENESGEVSSSDRAISAAYRRQLKARQRVRVRAARLAQSDINRTPTKSLKEDTSTSTSPNSTTQASPSSISSSPSAPAPRVRMAPTKQRSKRQILMSQQRSHSSKQLTRKPSEKGLATRQPEPELSQGQVFQRTTMPARRARQPLASNLISSGAPSVTSSTEGKRTKLVRFKIKSSTSTLVVRFQCAPTIQAVQEHLAQRLGQSQKMQLKYYDAENDCCLLIDDSDVEEAIRAALLRRDSMVRLEMEPDTSKTPSSSSKSSSASSSFWSLSSLGGYFTSSK